ncbi:MULTISPECIES: NADH-quinone oxidoreductase subunit NuoE [unclassified Rhodococcus (in: high G+C Gram-positive bacteria)]|uniref:NADH-quinone oxidoreductase subunit NuoE n=1 Tax=unclassified Rhodococcus (in: high G+C Gram-positive bacteria) TaxID=192944 RepID=UPI001639A65B|nr:MULTISPECIES: NADH-quinone oxidoreductase subunit NuoE [unclassified Rhodococcus (in: high G+C Gram-positive bacteria)]MBC2643141.1 NADH-quinone oxidoreductase subunit NuoE [Rhodococcus sp. 3A]MBC2892118.1 NADH-quinone oxidoreductase subunit NuoE [Rhodococcus sp. 4CII]
MTERAAPVFIEFGPRQEENGLLVRPGARAAYPPEIRARLDADADAVIGRYPSARSALLPLLHLVQAEDGCITPAGIEFCAGRLGLTGAEVAAVATFYSMYRRDPTGDYYVGVCTNTLCAIMGGDAILAALEEHLDLPHGGTTADGKITLEHIECNAACDYAPVVMVNWEFFDNQTPESARSLVDALRSGEQVTPSRGATLCTFRETARVLAGFPDERPGVSGAGAGAATLAGLRVARELGMEAPDPGATSLIAERQSADTESAAAESTKREPAPAPSATVPPDRSTSETDPAATDPGRKGD